MYVGLYVDVNAVNFEEGPTAAPGRTRSGRVASQDIPKQSAEKVRIL